MKQSIATNNAPKAIGPYSQGIKAGNFVFVSGQIPVEPATGNPAGDTIESQTNQSLKNIAAVLKEAGYSMADVVKTTVFLNDMNDFAGMNQVYETFFPEPYPSRAAVQAARLPKDVLVEIEAIAYKD